MLSSGQEFRNALWGHIDLLGHSQVLYPLSTGPALTSGEKQQPDHPANAIIIRRARALGATPIVAHGGNLGQEGVADLILGDASIMEVLQFGDYTGLDLWYDLLSAGYDIAPAGGTDYPVGELPGTERTVVRPRTANYSGWLYGLVQGHGFVTNGPWLEMLVDGKRPGDTLNVQPGDSVTVRIEMTAADVAQPAQDLQCVVGGQPVTGKISSQGRIHTWEAMVPISEPTWVAARTMPVAQKNRRLAHTAAVRICIEGQEALDRGARQRLVRRIERLLRTAETRAVFAAEAQEAEVLTLFRAALEKARGI
jgi:hypothetical protein